MSDLNLLRDAGRIALDALDDLDATTYGAGLPPALAEAHALLRIALAPSPFETAARDVVDAWARFTASDADRDYEAAVAAIETLAGALDRLAGP